MCTYIGVASDREDKKGGNTVIEIRKISLPASTNRRYISVQVIPTHKRTILMTSDSDEEELDIIEPKIQVLFLGRNQKKTRGMASD